MCHVDWSDVKSLKIDSVYDLLRIKSHDAKKDCEIENATIIDATN